MKTFVLALSAFGILTSTLAAPAIAKPNAIAGSIKTAPISTGQPGTVAPKPATAKPATAKPSSKNSAGLFEVDDFSFDIEQTLNIGSQSGG
jgi:hypothetical protein